MQDVTSPDRRFFRRYRRLLDAILPRCFPWQWRTEVVLQDTVLHQRLSVLFPSARQPLWVIRRLP